jgi:hypothetical protein
MHLRRAGEEQIISECCHRIVASATRNQGRAAMIGRGVGGGVFTDVSSSSRKASKPCRNR